jgi:hypothetical protein
MESEEWIKQGSKLRYDRQSDTYYLHVTVKQERDEPQSEVESRTVLGVDRNVDGYLAVTSSGAFIGNADLFNHKRREYERRRGKLHQTGTRSAYHNMRFDTFFGSFAEILAWPRLKSLENTALGELFSGRQRRSVLALVLVLQRKQRR